ncbi:MAG TPA: oligosaccharide flippase family protein [Acidimicrobiales bacterium]|nr:oligosaccharide flippase family protein [Acidimicrobiales bacterium]
MSLNDAPGAGTEEGWPSRRVGTERAGHLRDLSMRSGAYLMFRGGIGIAIRLCGILLVTRLIGPYAFGLYASAAAFVAVVATISQMGVEVYLIRLGTEPAERTYRTAFTLLLAISLFATGAGIAATYVVGALMHSPPYLAALRVLLISVPVNVCWAPAQARIERRFQYRKMAALEIVGDAVLYATSVPLAALGAGVWAPTIGFVAWQTFLFFASLWLAEMAPALAWDWSEVRRILRFGAGYSLTASVASLVGLVNPLVVGHFSGPRGVGYVSLTQRILTTLGFVNQAAWRLATVAFGRIGDDRARLRRGIEEAMRLQVLVLGVLLGAFATFSAIVVPLVFGHAWTGIVAIYPVLALAAMVSAACLVPQSLLYARDRNYVVALSQAAVLAILVPTAWVLTAHFGLLGFGVAFLLSRLGLLVIVTVSYGIVKYTYEGTIVWTCALAPILFAESVPGPWRPLLFVPAIVVATLPFGRHQIAEYSRVILSSFRRQLT